MTARPKTTSKQHRTLAAFSAVAAAAIAAHVEPAFALVGDSKQAIGLDGSFRSLGGLVRQIDPPLPDPQAHDVDGISLTLLRLVVSGHPSDFLFYEIHGVQSVNASSQDAGPQNGASSNRGVGLFGLTPQDNRYQALDASWNWHQDENVTASLWLDRVNAKLKFPGFDLTVGRQAISFGKAYFWNPLDVFLPFDARQFDRDYKAGVDAARFDLPFTRFSGFNIVGAMGRTLTTQGSYRPGYEAWDASWLGSAVLGRLYATWKGWDFSAQGGKIYGGYQAGGAFVGDLKFLQLRGEAAYFLADGKMRPLIDDHATAVAGVGHRFENTLDLQVEYLFNGGGHSKHFDLAFLRLLNGEILQMSKNVVGLRGTYELLPILVGSMGVLLSATNSPSASLQPGLDWSVSDNINWIFGAVINLGEHPDGRSPLGLGIKSEFGASADIYYTQIKWYF